VAASEPINCLVTQSGLDARADAFGVPVEQLPPPDGLLRPGDTYTSTSGCAKGDLVTQTTATGTTVTAGGNSTPPLVAVVLICLVLIIAALITYYVVKRTRFARAEREAFLEAELREDHYRGRL
jgi:hypothetical protein